MIFPIWDLWILRIPIFLSDGLLSQFFYWNIRGAFSPTARHHIRDLVKTHQPSLFCVCETHGHFVKVSKFWRSLGYNAMFIQKARGHSRGIWVLGSLQDTIIELINNMYQTTTFSIKRDNAVWFFTSIYASPNFAMRCNLDSPEPVKRCSNRSLDNCRLF